MFGSWVSRIPVGKRTRVHVMLLTGLGTTIILLALYQTWLGLVTAGRDVLVSFALLIVSVPTRLYLRRAEGHCRLTLVHRFIVHFRCGDGETEVWIYVDSGYAWRHVRT